MGFSFGQWDKGVLAFLRFPLQALVTKLWLAVLVTIIVVLAPNAAQAQIFVNKSFSPANVVVGQTTTLNITILNNSISPATSVAVTDSFPTSPSGLKVAAGGLLSNSCGGTVTATPGATSVSLSGGTIAAAVSGVAGSCSIAIQVVATPASTPANILNTIPATNISSNAGPGSSSASATLAVSAASPITGNKTFVPATLQGNGAVSRMTIQLNNANSFALTGAAFTDTFPTQMQLAATPNVANSCGGAVTAVGLGTSLSLSGGTIPASGSCTIVVDMVARNATTVATNAVVTNSIAALGVNTAETVRNAAVISGTVTVRKAAAVTKAFAPASMLVGSSSTLTLTLFNFNATAITGMSFSDAMPAGLTVTAGTGTTCGGTVTFTATSLGVTGASLPAAPLGGSSSCTITGTVTASAAGSYVNSVPAGSTGGVAYNAATATLTVVNGSAVSKSFSPSTISPGGTSLLVVTLSNTSGVALTGFNITDPLPTGVTTSGTGTTTCGGSVGSTASSITLTGGSLAAGTTASPRTCTFRINVTGTLPNAYVNTIPAGNLAGMSYSAASATLIIRAVGVSKAFNLTTVPRSGTSLLTLTLVNASTASAAAITSISDNLTTLGTGFTVASSPAPNTTCGGTVTATPGATSFSMSGGSIPIAPSASVTGSCTITVPVLVGGAATIATHVNTIPVGALVTSIGSNTAAATANLAVTTGVTVAKAFSPSSVGAGGITRLTISVTRPANAGVFTNLVVTDPLPSGFVVAPVPNAATTCPSGVPNATPGATTTGLTSGTLGSAAALASPASCTVSVDVTAASTLGSYTNTIPVGNVIATTAGGNVANTAAATAVVQVVSSVNVNKAFSPVNITPGGISTLTIFLSNSSASSLNLTNVSFSDALPSGLVLAATPNATFTTVSGTCSASLSATAGSSSLGFSAGTINAGSVCELSADVTTAAIGAMINQINPGNLASTQGITNTNSTAATLVSSGTSDVSVTKSNGVTQLTAGTSTTYTVVVSNNSASMAVVGVPVTDAEPSGMTFTNWTCVASSGSTCAAGSGAGAIATTVSLAQLGTATFTVTALLDQGYTATDVTNNASVNPSAAGINDTDPGNDSASDSDTVVRSADLVVSKSVNNAAPIVGDQVDFTVTVNNVGPSLASAVAVSDALPPGYTFVSSTATVGSYAAPTWTVGDLGSGSSATLHVIATVNATGPYLNTAAVSSSTADPDTGNNSASASTTPLTASITVSKSASAPGFASGTNPLTVDGGDSITYTFTITNTGTATLNNVMPVDAGPTFNGSAGTGTAGAFSPAFAALAPGGSQVFTMTYVMSDLDVYRAVGVTNAVANTANASALTPSGNTIAAAAPANATTSIPAQPALEFTKSYVLTDLPGGTTGMADVGETITYTYAVSNTGNTLVSSVNILDDHENHNPDLTSAQIQGETLSADGPLAALPAPIVSTDAGDNGVWDQLQPGASVTFTYIHTVTQTEVDGS